MYKANVLFAAIQEFHPMSLCHIPLLIIITTTLPTISYGTYPHHQSRGWTPQGLASS